MNKYNNFTVEETNLLSIYMTGSKEGLVVAMNAALPFMDGEMRDFAARTIRCHTNFRHPFNLSWSGKTCDIRRSSKTTS